MQKDVITFLFLTLSVLGEVYKQENKLLEYEKCPRDFVLFPVSRHFTDNCTVPTIHLGPASQRQAMAKFNQIE